MTEIIKETITTQGSSTTTNPTVTAPQKVVDGDSGNPILTTQVKTGASNSETIEYLLYFFFGLLEILLAFRLLLKLTGASTSSPFVGLVYGVTGLFILPFQGIFRQGYNPNVSTTSVLEPSIIIALIVYPILAWGIVKLIRISTGEKQIS